VTRDSGVRDAAAAVAEDPTGFLATALRRDAAAAPVVSGVLALVIGVFLVEAAVAVRYAGGHTAAVVAHAFVTHPELAWALAPFLHQTLRHALANVVVLALAAPVEARLGRRATLGLLLAAGYLPLFLEAATLGAATTAPHVAAYGASAFGYGLLGGGLVVVLRRGSADPRLWLVAVAGVAAVLTVALDVLTSLGAPLAVNYGHLGGLAAGGVAGRVAGRR
jgi:membrane associated rhomboid family serine protease